MRMGLVADPVIQAIGRLEFEDGLRTGVLQEVCWCPYGVRNKPMVNAKYPYGVRQNPWGNKVWMQVGSCSLVKPNSYRRVPHCCRLSSKMAAMV